MKKESEQAQVCFDGRSDPEYLDERIKHIIETYGSAGTEDMQLMGNVSLGGLLRAVADADKKSYLCIPYADKYDGARLVHEPKARLSSRLDPSVEPKVNELAEPIPPYSSDRNSLPLIRVELLHPGNSKECRINPDSPEQVRFDVHPIGQDFTYSLYSRIDDLRSSITGWLVDFSVDK